MNNNNLTNSNKYGTIACKKINASSDITCDNITPNTLLGFDGETPSAICLIASGPRREY